MGWKFEHHEDGWEWRCSSDDGITASAERFSTFLDAERDAMDHGYVPGVSSVSAIGESDGIGRASPRSGFPGGSSLVMRHRTRDRYGVGATSADFATREEYQADAAWRGVRP